MYNFDVAPNRAGTDSVKWHHVSGDVLPMWVADMDLQCAPEIVEAIMARAAHPYYGYPYTQDALTDVVAAHYKRTYGVEVDREWIVWVPSVISGVVNALELLGGTFMYSVPMYDHIRRLYEEAKLPVVEVPMRKDANDHYTMDMAALEAALTPEIKCLILCNPHNPVGRVYTREELEEISAFGKKHGLLVISDEIHCELDLENRHIPFFAVNAENTITLSSAGKICNIPGLPMGFAIIPDAKLRDAFSHRQDGLLPSPNVISLAAYEKAYDGTCALWKEELRAYLRQNRDLAEARFAAIDGITTPHNEGTYLLWLDCSALGLENPSQFFLEKAHVMVSDGEIYGNRQCVRFNYGCTRAQLVEAIDRIEAAVAELMKTK